MNPQNGTPGWGLFLCFLLEVFFLLITVGGYGALISAINVAFMVAYAIGPMAFGVLRHTAPGVERPFRLPAAGVPSPLAFVLASVLLYWSEWPETGETLAVLLVGVVIYFIYAARGRVSAGSLRHGSWLVAYLVAMALLSWLGDRQFGGINVIPFGWDLVAVAVVSLAIYAWGVRQGVRYAEEAGGAESG